jgi:DNA-binding response OmpR family regulator
VQQTVCLLEDDPDISRLVDYHLTKAGYAVRSFGTGRTVLAQAEREKPDLFVLDVMVPDGSGLDVCRRVRESETLKAIPIIFLTARAAETDRVRGLELGADDYVTKPFSPRELVARVRAVLRRSVPREDVAPAAPLQIDNIEIDSAAMQLRVRGELVTMTSTEFRLLDYLARHPGRMFSRDQLLDAVWGDSRFVTPRSVDVYVRRIREKIEDDPEAPRYLRTMRGAGYRFDIPKSPNSETGPDSLQDARGDVMLHEPLEAQPVE